MEVKSWLWALFSVIVVISLAIDLGMKSHRHRTEAITMREAGLWTSIWVGLALSFGLVVLFALGRQAALEFYTAYLVEESLSVDNMFVFILIFDFFHVPAIAQPRVLKWGILGAILMRFVLIFTGVALLQKFHWILYLFGGVLVLTALQMFFEGEKEMKPGDNVVLKLCKRFLPITEEFHGHSFFLHHVGKLAATPLFAALLVIEASDLVFALDSIPACLAISKSTFVIFTSNIFAVLGLRALYFLVSGFMKLFRYLRIGLAIVLLFIGVKMLLTDIFHIPISVSLGVVVGVLGLSVAASLWIPQKPKAHS